MTKYDDMTPRERDAWAAEHVFKLPVKWLPCWRDFECGELHVQGSGPAESDGTNEPCYFPSGREEMFLDKLTYWEVVPSYSTDASADYLVLKYVREAWDSSVLIKFEIHLEGLLATYGSAQAMNYRVSHYINAAWLALNEG